MQRLFVAKCRLRIDARGANGRNERGRHAYCEQQHATAGKYEWVARRSGEEEATHDPCDRQTDQQASEDSIHDKRDSV